jgi:hypothetical protein
VYADFALLGIIGSLTYRQFNDLGFDQENMGGGAIDWLPSVIDVQAG